MARVTPLSDRKIKSLKKEEKEYKVADGDGLYILVRPNGSKHWRYRKGNLTRAVGTYPHMTLQEARIKRDKIKHEILYGVAEVKNKYTFRELSKLYFKHRIDLQEDTKASQVSHLDRDFMPYIGDKYAEDITIDDMIAVISRMEDRNLKDATRRGSNLANRIFKYAVTKRLTDNNPISSIDLSILLKKHKKGNRPHVTTREELKEIILTLDTYIGDINTKVAITVMPYVFVRPDNLAKMEWEEIDFKKKMWIIPAKKMKMRKEHIVPLSDTVIGLIEQLRGNESKYVFHSPRTRLRPISRDTPNSALARKGFRDIQSAHGFRHTASTLLNENIHVHSVHSDAIEAQLAHVDNSTIKGTYNKALYLEERIKLMNWWSNYLDELRA